MKRRFRLYENDQSGGKYLVLEGSDPIFDIEYSLVERKIFIKDNPGRERELVLQYPQTFFITEIVNVFYKENSAASHSYIKKRYVFLKGKCTFPIRELGSAYDCIFLKVGVAKACFYFDNDMVAQIKTASSGSKYTLHIDTGKALSENDILFMNALAFFHYGVMTMRS